MRLENISRRTYQHCTMDKNMRPVILTLAPKENKEIPDEVAEKWLKTGEVREYIDPKAAKEKAAKIEAENAQLKEEIEKLKKQEDKKEEKNTKAKKK